MANLGSGIALDDLVRRSVNIEVYKRLTGAGNKPPEVQAFWKYLLLCFETPRPSTDYCEPDTLSRLDAIRQALSLVANRLGATPVEDKAGNLIITKAGCGSGVGKPPLCLQGHLDMVVSQNEGANHDFEKDPIEVRFSSDDGVVDGWIKAVKATTLGADNGVALAASLAVLEAVENHPPLELLFTANEETNFMGAENLLPGTLKSKRLLNLDTEDDGTIILGSAGIFEHHYKLPVERVAYSEGTAGLCPISVKLTGLHGGHSGVDIHKGYGNANNILARLMLSACKPEINMHLVSLSGGSGPTAIAREATCTVLVHKDSAVAFCEDVSQLFSKLQGEFKSKDPGMDLTLAVCSAEAPDLLESATESDPVAEFGYCKPVASPAKRNLPTMNSWECSRCEKCVIKAIESGADLGTAERTAKRVRRSDIGPLTRASTQKVWQFCCNMPSGVMRMSAEVEGLVESSVNFGVVTLLDDHLFCHLCARSSSSSFLESYQRVLSGFGELTNATNVENIAPGSPWQPNFNSELLPLLKRVFAKQSGGKEPHVTVIHAGLEPGLLIDSHHDLDCCSIGPNIQDAHSPDERVSIASAERFMMWVKAVVETMAHEG